jgi:uncharacterized protein (TIGR03067 family)
MTRFLALLLLIGAISLTFLWLGNQHTIDFVLLEGPWAEDVPKGDGLRASLYFSDGQVGWTSMHYTDGQPVIGHSKRYKVKLNADATPKEITFISIDEGRPETRVGVYELNGDVLKLAIADDDRIPKNVDDKAATVYLLKRIKKE